MKGKPVWESSEDDCKPDREQCRLGNHTWVAFFFGSGRLAYREHPCQNTDHFWLTRYQVIDNELVLFRAHCFEESTLETPSAQKPKKKTILSGLKLISRKTEIEK